MNKKTISLAISVVIILGLFIPSFTLSKEYKPLKPMNLNYSYDSLEPYIDKETMLIKESVYMNEYNSIETGYNMKHSVDLQNLY